MSASFHESYGRGDIAPPTERATGFAFAFAAVVVAVLWRESELVRWIALALAVALALFALLAPTMLRPLSIVWFRIGLLLHRIVNPIVMFAIFAFVFVPAGYLMRIWHDPLKSRRAQSGLSYWTKPDAGTRAQRSMRNQL
jgi:hypothetical protein